MSPLFEYIGTTYHFYEVARVLSNPSRHYGGVQWVFSPPVHCLPFAPRPSKGVLPIPSESIQKSLKSSQIRIGWKSVSDEEEKQH